MSGHDRLGASRLRKGCKTCGNRTAPQCRSRLRASRLQNAEGHCHGGKSRLAAPVVHDSDRKGGVPGRSPVAARPLGQTRRHGAETPQLGRRQHEGALDREACSKILFLARAVRRQHPFAEHPARLEGRRHLPRRMLRRVMGRKPCPGQRRQKQHRHQRARTAAVSADRLHAAHIHAEHIHAPRAHPKVNPISLAPAPSSQLAVTCATVTGEARAVPFTVIETIPARARVRPA